MKIDMVRGSTELSIRNYKRIFWTNLLISLPLLAFFAWPYYQLGYMLEDPEFLLVPGMVLFSVAFTFTVLHGYVTMSLGIPHRAHYYQWLTGRRWSYGLLFHPIFSRTRFRLILVIISLIFLVLGPLFQ